MFKNIIDAGPENVDDYLGTRFKYKCPFATCDNSSKNRMKTYSMHCAVFQNQLEVALAWLTTTLTALRRSERLFFTTENLPLLPLIWQCRNLQYKQVEFQQSDQFKVPLRPGLWLLLWQRHWYDGEEVHARFRQYQPEDWQSNRRDREEEKIPLRHAKLQERKEKCLVIIVWGTRRFDGDYGVGLYCWHWIRL